MLCKKPAWVRTLVSGGALLLWAAVTRFTQVIVAVSVTSLRWAVRVGYGWRGWGWGCRGEGGGAKQDYNTCRCCKRKDLYGL